MSWGPDKQSRLYEVITRGSYCNKKITYQNFKAGQQLSAGNLRCSLQFDYYNWLIVIFLYTLYHKISNCKTYLIVSLTFKGEI